MEAIHVELPDETVHFVMSKEKRKDDLFELGDVLDDKIFSSGSPKNSFGVFLRLSKFRVVH